MKVHEILLPRNEELVAPLIQGLKSAKSYNLYENFEPKKSRAKNCCTEIQHHRKMFFQFAALWITKHCYYDGKLQSRSNV